MTPHVHILTDGTLFSTNLMITHDQTSRSEIYQHLLDSPATIHARNIFISVFLICTHLLCDIIQKRSLKINQNPLFHLQRQIFQKVRLKVSKKRFYN